MHLNSAKKPVRKRDLKFKEQALLDLQLLLDWAQSGSFHPADNHSGGLAVHSYAHCKKNIYNETNNNANEWCLARNKKKERSAHGSRIVFIGYCRQGFLKTLTYAILIFYTFGIYPGSPWVTYKRKHWHLPKTGTWRQLEPIFMTPSQNGIHLHHHDPAPMENSLMSSPRWKWPCFYDLKPSRHCKY